MSTLIEYYNALERLKAGKPQIVPQGTKITKDAVSLEAGRGKGTIKKSREQFAELIQAIDDAAKDQENPKTTSADKLKKSNSRCNKYKELYEEALAREVMFVRRIYHLEAKISKLTPKS